jgi:hypothetical protein
VLRGYLLFRSLPYSSARDCIVCFISFRRAVMDLDDADACMAVVMLVHVAYGI